MSDVFEDSKAIRACQAVDFKIARLEARLTIHGTSALLAMVLLLVASVYVRPALQAVSHGRYYAQLSLDPLQPADNPNAHRILTPLLSFLLGLRGDRILLTNLIIVAILLATVYQYARRSELPPLVSACCAAAMALSMPTLATIYFGGYPDAMTCLLLIAMMACGGPLSFGILLLLALLNHEAVVFLLPFFLLFALQRGGRWQLVTWIVTSAAALSCYWAVRQSLLNTNADTVHSAEYYLGPLRNDLAYGIKQVAGAYYAGWFSGFKLLWLFPIIGVATLWKRQAYLRAAVIVTPVICCMCQTLVAIDTSRMMSFAFPSVLLGVDATYRYLGQRKTELIFLTLMAMNFLVPQLYVWGNKIAVMHCLPTAILRHLLF